MNNGAKNYTIEGAKLLKKLGFSDHFCKICEGVQRNENDRGKRMNECDILELVDQFGGMLMHRPERIAYTVDEAVVLLEHRNLKGKTNKYLEKFKKFVNETEEIKI